jgi:hypothetical protein
MIIDDLNTPCVSVLPLKAKSPLLVNSDAVLTFSVPRQSLQLIGWWYPKILYGGASIQHLQLPKGDLLNISRQSFGKLPVEYLFCFAARKAFNHRVAKI